MSAKKQLDYRIPLAIGLVVFGVSVLAEEVFLVASPVWGTLLVVLASAFVLWGVALGRAQSAFGFDERFVMHRLKSTRLAAVVGLLMMVGWFGYEAHIHRVYYWHLLVIVSAMALSKLAAMIYYRLTD
jgi:uncharacterized membrane protein YraQ (UPF0718 family)